jgi:hypothetical protein
MLPNDRAQPAARDKPSWGARILRWVGKAPLVKVSLVAAAVISVRLEAHLVRHGLAGPRRGPEAARARGGVTRSRLGRAGRFLLAGAPAWIIALLACPFAVAWAATPGRWPAGTCRAARRVGHAVVAAGRGRPAAGLAAPAAHRGDRGHPHRRWPSSAGGWPRACRMPGCTARTARPSPDSRRQTGGRARRPGQGSARAGGPVPTPVLPGTASGPRPPRCPTPITPPATIRPVRPGPGRRSRSRTPWPSSTR